MKTLDFGLEIKSLDDSGVLRGFASTYNNVDRDGDVVLPGAFAKTLRESNGKVPILWQHDQREPVGVAELTDDPGRGLLLKGQLDLDVEIGRRAYSALKKRIVGGLSIGYQTVRSTMKNGVRQLAELKLYEVSIVTIPANAEAIVTSVKATGGSDMAGFEDLSQQLAHLAAETNLRALLNKMSNFSRRGDR